MNVVAGIAGIRPYQPGRDGADLVRSALRRYAAGPCSTVVRDGVILAVASTFDDAPAHPQPYEAPCGTLLAFDGRMDQVEGHELLAPDTDLDTLGRITASYGTRGTGMFEHLAGDYGLVVYEERTTRLLMARDFVGAKHLFYARTKEAIYFASNLTVLLHLAPVSVDPDMHYIAQFFAGTVDTGRSPYREIASVRAGAWMSVDLRDGSVEERPYWFAHTVPPLRYAREEEYDEHFRQVLQQSVRRRMRSPRRVLADLSGGLDSSSIVCMADRVAREMEWPRVETWTARYSDSALEDESAYVEALEAHRGLPTQWLRQTAEETLRTKAIPEEMVAPCFLYYAPGIIHALNALCEIQCAEVQLCGYGGDQVLWNCGEFVSGDLLDAASRGNLLRVLREAVTIAKRTGQPAVSALKANWTVWRHYSRARKRSLGILPAAKILNRRFLQQYGRSAESRKELADREFAAFTTRMQAAFIDELRSGVQIGLHPEELHTERRYPYLDRNLNEFLLAIPHQVKKVIGENRSLMRRSLRGIVPDMIRTRRTKGLIDVTLNRACAGLAEYAPGMTAASPGCTGILAPAAWRGACERVAHGLENQPGYVVHALVVDLWLNRRPGVATPVRSTADRKSFEATSLKTSPDLTIQ